MPTTETSISQKLRSVVMLTAALILGLTLLPLIVYEFFSFRRNLLDHLSTVSSIVAANSTAAVAFGDSQDATENLASLQQEPYVVAAAIYDKTGKLFAEWRRTPAQTIPAAPGQEGHRITGGQVELFAPVREAGLRHGTIYISANPQALYNRAGIYSIVILFVLGSSGLAAYFLARAMQRRISEPILALSKTARQISEERDYSVRAAKMSSDEIGLLTEAFNDMLSQIQERDQRLSKAHAELETRVSERTAELETTNKELESFTYSVSHDLRAPLRHIDAYAQAMEEELQAEVPEIRRYLGRIRHGVKQMGQLVDDLLHLARLGRSELTLQTTDLNQLVHTVAGELKKEAEGRDVVWEISELPPVKADPGLLKQVYYNLLANALKYTRPRQKAIITVGVLKSGPTPVFYVRDNGVGFNMKYAHKLFGVFQRLHRAEEFEGTGVGLATVERIIRKHGGRVWAEAELDKGATFYFTLNRGAADAPTRIDKRQAL